MFLTFEERLSDSPCVERVWCSRSQAAGKFVSVANSHVEMAVTRHRGKIFLTVRGPETKATEADCPSDGEWLGIRFKLGSYVPAFAPAELKDRHDMNLPGATGKSFWLNGSAWEYPDFERSLKTLIGQTPVQIEQGRRQLSFLYKTTPPPGIYDAHGRLPHDCIGTNGRPY